MSFHFFISNLLEPISYGLCGLSLLFYTQRGNQLKWKILLVYYFIAVGLQLKAAYAETNIGLYSLLSSVTFLFLGAYFYQTLFASWKKKLVLLFCAIRTGYNVIANVLYPGAQVFDSTAYVILSSGVVLIEFL